MVAADLVFPLIVVEHDDGYVRLIASVDDGRKQLEAIDVSSGEYAVWDAEGRPCLLSVGRRPDWLLVQLDDPGRAGDAWGALESAARRSCVSLTEQPSPLARAREIAAAQRSRDSMGLLAKLWALVAPRKSDA